MPHKDPEARKAYQAAYRAAHADKKREQGNASYQRNRDAILERRAERKAKLTEAELQAKHEQERRYCATYRARNAEALRRMGKERRIADPERERGYQARYRAKRRELLRPMTEARRLARAEEREVRRRERELRRKNRPTTKEQRAARREAARKWRARNPDKVSEYTRRWRARHPDKVQAYVERNRVAIAIRNRAWHEANRERRRIQKRARYWRDPVKHRQWAMNHHIQKVSRREGEIDLNAIVARDRGRCQICGKPVERRDWSFDHIVPLSKGGVHAQWNLQLAHFRCNARRGAGRIPGQIRLPL